MELALLDGGTLTVAEGSDLARQMLILKGHQQETRGFLASVTTFACSGNSGSAAGSVETEDR